MLSVALPSRPRRLPAARCRRVPCPPPCLAAAPSLSRIAWLRRGTPCCPVVAWCALPLYRRCV